MKKLTIFFLISFVLAVLNGKVFNLKPSKILLSNTGITAIIDTNASLKLLVNGF